MQDLLPQAERLAELLKARRETIVVAESSAGGLISAALLAIAGASAYFLGGAVVYTGTAREALFGIAALPQGMRASTEPYALLLAQTARQQFGATWALAETGATGPTGNRYGDAAGHACIAVAGPVERAITLKTGSADRIANMRRFAATALDLLEQSLAGQQPARS
jgi:nicotinamide-nucleotide amidase